MDIRTPPHNKDAEESVLGALILDPELFVNIVDIVSSDDFYVPAHKTIYSAIKSLNQTGKSVDIITLVNYLKDQKQIDSIGGTAYLAEVMERVPTTIHIEDHARIINDKSKLRQLIKANYEIIEKAYAQKFENLLSFMDEVEGQIFSLADNEEKKSGLVDAADLIKLSIDRLTELSANTEDITGVSTGFSELDNLTAGFQSGDLIILAARPSMGKTALSLNIAQYAAFKQKKHVAYFSVEMAKEQVMMRILACEAKINLSDIRVGKIKDNDWPKLIETASKISECPLFIDDTSGISPFEIRAKCRRLKSKKALDLIIIDYLQIMDLKQKVESRERAVAEISRSLKALAKELEVPVVALAQLNRSVEGRSGDQKKPILSDLRESGSIEQDADLIMMLYREEYYDPDNPYVKGLADCLVRKHRNGPIGEIKLNWQGQFGRFSDYQGPPPSQIDTDMLMPPPNMGGGSKNYAPRK